MSKAQEAQSSPQETHQATLLRRFGATVLNGGYTCIPNLLMKYQAELLLNPTQFNIICHIWMSWWEHYPYPAITTIAARMNRGRRCIQVNLRKIEQKIIDEASGEVVRPSLLESVARFNQRGQTTNEYDFTRLLRALEDLEINWQNERTEPKEEIVYSVPPANLSTQRIQIHGPRESGFTDPANLDSHNEDESKKTIEFDSSNLSNSNKERSLGYTNHSGASEHYSERYGDANASLDGEGEHESTPNESSSQDTNRNRNNRNPRFEEVPPEATEQARTSKRLARERITRELKDERPQLPPSMTTFITDFSREFHDEAPASSVTRVARVAEVARRSGMSKKDFIDALFDARTRTKKGNVTKLTKDGMHRNSMPYFLETLEYLVEYDIAKREGAER